MRRSITRIATLAAISGIIVASGFTTAEAQVGTQGFADIGAPSVDTGDINTGEMFSIGDLISTGAQTGVFSGMPARIFSGVTLNDTVGTSLVFGDAVFGTFSSLVIDEFANSPGSVSFYVLGLWAPGVYVGGSGLYPASMTISFTQTPAGSGSISDSATFSVPPTGVPSPEPATVTMLGSALLLLAGFRLLKRRRVA